MIRLPGLIDSHVHVRQPGGTYKEDWDTATSAALAGGFSAILAMPNTQPPIFDDQTLALALQAAGAQARCDYAQFIGAGPENVQIAARLAPQVAGLKMYLDSTFGELRLDRMTLWQQHFVHFPAGRPIVTHSESRSMAAAILFAAIYRRPVHIAHISLREEVLLIKVAKQHGLPVTCEVTPHHLFLTQEDIPFIGREFAGMAEVRPRLASRDDVEALWANLDVIDCIASDHAPHTLTEKQGTAPPPGFPGLETSLPLMLTAVRQGRITRETLIEKMFTQPQRIFGLPQQPETWVEVDESARYRISSSRQFTKCGWTPFEGFPVQGKVLRVVLRGQTVFQNGKILAAPGFGCNLKP